MIAGRYKLIEQIGDGGMGIVWLGHDSVLEREVAVKLIRPEVVPTPEWTEVFAERFRNEARITAGIQHYGVPQVFDAGLDQSYDRLYLVMELLRGSSLAEFIGPQHPLPFSWVAAIGAQIATVLSHAHAVPVVHRDLKPANVFVAADGTVKVLDFGIARVLGSDRPRLTGTGIPIGTGQYMSPEQHRALRAITPSSDLYSLGCVLHELVSGEPVFDSEDRFELARLHVETQPVPLRELRPDVPEPLENLVLRLLSKAPDQRPADAFEVYERLLPLLPLPGTPALPSDELPVGVPDPTLLYRRPNAPRQRADGVHAVPSPTLLDPAAQHYATPATDLRDAIRSAFEQSGNLLRQGHVSDALAVLEPVIARSSDLLGPDSPRVLQLRMRHAAVLVLAENPRRALPEFEALATAYARTEGAASKNALECRRQAAHCRADLGQPTRALHLFREVLEQVRAQEGDVSETAVDLRRNIGILLLEEGRHAEASAVLRPLYDDLCLLHGSEHEDSQELAALIRHLRPR
ncbi:protein kinase domain-containing protein [Kitasatospora purpeofusca]|uniref:serine/threonine-protein kinase n=1 Tax=Kitasatospora purpeofusca TaxID=67352 RepID=UPI003F4A9DCF